MAVDGCGNVFVADQQNKRIRQLTPASATPTRAARAAAAVLLYPNPASVAFTVLMPAATGQVQVNLLNALGQPVRRQLAAAGTPFAIETAGLAPGVYTLRLQADSVTLAQRVVLQ